jgi:hypothetical protein
VNTVKLNGLQCEVLLDNVSDRSLISKRCLEKYFDVLGDSVKMTKLPNTHGIYLADSKSKQQTKGHV